MSVPPTSLSPTPLPPPSGTSGGRGAAALVAVRVAPLLGIALPLTLVAAFFMLGGPVNIGGFVAVQRITGALPDAFWSCVTICGAGVVAFALLSPTLARQPRYFAAAIAAAAFAGAYSNGMKRLFGLPRPAAVLDPTQLHAIGHALRANTFPSGHSVTAFTLASLLTFASTRPLATAAWTVPLATLVALSRIAVGAHWPADLAAGAAGGWLCGALGVVVVARWRGWNTIGGVRAMALVSIAIGASLFVVDLGYPQASALQSASGAIAIVAGIATLARPRVDPRLPRAAPP